MKNLFQFWLMLKVILCGGFVDYDTNTRIKANLRNLNSFLKYPQALAKMNNFRQYIDEGT